MEPTKISFLQLFSSKETFLKILKAKAKNINIIKIIKIIPNSSDITDMT